MFVWLFLLIDVLAHGGLGRANRRGMKKSEYPSTEPKKDKQWKKGWLWECKTLGRERRKKERGKKG